jgi:hypothetical protein
LPLLFLILSLLLASYGCSHVKPFYRQGLTPITQPAPQSAGLSCRLLLLGVAGAARDDEPTLDLLTRWASRDPDRTIIIFLGDNIYDYGMPPEDSPDRREMERRIQVQIDAVTTSGCRGLFIPGNHDWRSGLPGLMRQAAYIRERTGDPESYLPPPGWPGPVKVDVENIRIIALDSNIWVNPHLHPGGGSPWQSLDESLAALESMLESSRDRQVVVVAHHPLASHGAHGGFYDWRDHLFPLTDWKDWLWLPMPLIGSLYPVLRWHVVRHYEELNGRPYRTMIQKFSEAFSLKRPLIYAAGHDHALQVLKGRAVDYILVSGGGIDSRLSKVTDGPDTLFAHLHSGFMAVDFLLDGEVWLSVVEPSDKEVVFMIKLTPSPSPRG